MSAQTRRMQILDVTENVLVDAGGAGLTMRKIAASSGISLGNLQYHFATREDLMLALLMRFLAPYEDRLKQLPKSLPEDVADALSGIFMDVLNDPNFDRCATIYKEIWAASSHSNEMRNALNAYYTRLAQFYRALLSRLARPETAPQKIERAAAAIMPILEGYCITKDTVDVPVDIIAVDWATMVAALLR